MKHTISILLFLVICQFAYPQEVTQTIRGSIKDKDSKYNLIGAAVSVYQNNDLITGGTSDVDGYFKAAMCNALRRGTRIAASQNGRTMVFDDDDDGIYHNNIRLHTHTNSSESPSVTLPQNLGERISLRTSLCYTSHSADSLPRCGILGTVWWLEWV